MTVAGQPAITPQSIRKYTRTIMELLGRCIVHSKDSKDKKKLSNRELMAVAAECKDRIEANRSGSSSEDKEDEDGNE